VRAAIAALALAASLFASEASDLFRSGGKAEKSGQIARAYLLYSEAAALDSRNKLYRLKTEALRSRAALETKATLPAALDSGEIVVDPDPE